MAERANGQSSPEPNESSLRAERSNDEAVDIALTGRPIVRVPMAWHDARHTLDLPAIDAALAAGGRTVLISSPHNPLGRVYSRDELAGLAAVVERHRGPGQLSDTEHELCARL